ncbi:MAG: hypothetical protein DMG35_08625 [Acidobacteria bacterium]|nr:MAG: hypothetical protein DMG35_08625 [Acidobacteriota bacterium]
MHRQKSCGLLYWEPSIRIGLDMEMRYSSIFFIKEENLTGGNRLGAEQLLRTVTSVDYLHVHPLRMQPRDGTEANQVFILCPSTRQIPRAG